MTNTGVWNCSARSNASMAMLKHSSGEDGNSIGCRVSPCDSSAVDRMSPCAVRVGRPVEGPTRCTSKITAGNLGVVAQAHELRHEGNAGTRGRSHRARSRPCRAQHHADRGQLVFGLHHGVRRLAGFFVDAEALQVADHGFHQRRGRRDGIPGDDGDAGEYAAQRRGGIAFDDDLARGGVHALDAVRIGFW